ncbi:MAG TPA: hypothetical protein VL989_01400 [Candidatus Sulfotelmatobacter sp.]|nr:hypothetical protein [Candidatus Sulfotelmatobacter sp.]
MKTFVSYSTGKIKTISSDGDTISGVYTSDIGKKKFKKLIKKASQPVPKEQGK